MAVDFGLLNTELPEQIATSFSRGYEGAQKLAQEKEVNALNLKIKKEELNTFQQDRQKLLEFRNRMAKVGKGGNLRQISDVFLGSGIPDQMKLGAELLKGAEEHDRLAKALGEPTSDELFATAPSAPVAPAMLGTLGSGTFGMTPEPVAAPANALMPTPAPSAPANALMPTPAPAKRALTTEDKINNLIRGGFTEEARVLQAQLTASNPKNNIPTSVAEYERSLIDPSYMRFLQERAAATRPPAPVVNVTNVQEKAEAGEFGKFLVKDYENISKRAEVAQKSLSAIDANLNILNKGFETGFGTETKAAAAKVLSALGVEKANTFATNAQVFEAKAAEAILETLRQQVGPQTDADAKRVTLTGAQLANTTNSNKFLLDVAKATNKREIEQRNFYNKWRKINGSFDGAEEAWIAGEGGKSIFDRPELKKYVSPTSSAAQIPTTNASVAPATRTIPPAAVQKLLSGQGTDAQFDAIFGAGAAKRVRGSR
jgi:hypothetical protein